MGRLWLFTSASNSMSAMREPVVYCVLCTAPGSWNSNSTTKLRQFSADHDALTSQTLDSQPPEEHKPPSLVNQTPIAIISSVQGSQLQPLSGSAWRIEGGAVRSHATSEVTIRGLLPAYRHYTTLPTRKVRIGRSGSRRCLIHNAPPRQACRQRRERAATAVHSDSTHTDLHE